MTLLLPLLLACGALLACGDRNPGEELVGIQAVMAGEAVEAGETGCPDWYYDADADGYGDPDLRVRRCDEPVGYSSTSDDCDDISPLAFPGATEVCGNGLDEDCDGADLPCELPASGLLRDFATRVATITPDDEARQPLAMGDVNGDGQADLVLGRPDLDSNSGRARILWGPLEAEREDWDAEVAFLDVGGDGDSLGAAVLAGFDADGDGVDDLVLGAPQRLLGDRGAAILLPGPLSDTTWAEDGLTFHTSSGAEGLGATLAGGLDLTGDAVPDLVLGSCCDGASPGWVLPGPVTSSDLASTAFKITPAGGARQSFDAMAVGDATGDGIAELAVGESTPDSGPQEGRAWLIEGPIDGALDLFDAQTRFFSTSSQDSFASTLLLADLDDDGLDDLVVGAPLREEAGVPLGMVFVLLAPASRGAIADTLATTTLVGTAAEPYIGFSVQALQLDGAGPPELLVGAPVMDGFAGGVLVFADTRAGGTVTVADRRWAATAANGLVGWWMSAGADLDGDGAPDAVVAGLDDSGSGEAWILQGL